MKLTFVIGDTVPPLWIDGRLPLQKKRDWKVKVRLNNAKSASRIPPFGEIGKLLVQDSPSPARHAVTLTLTYLKGTTPPSTTPPSQGGWTDQPNSPIFDQILIALPAEAIVEIQEAEAEDYSFELVLDGVELEPLME